MADAKIVFICLEKPGKQLKQSFHKSENFTLKELPTIKEQDGKMQGSNFGLGIPQPWFIKPHLNNRLYLRDLYFKRSGEKGLIIKKWFWGLTRPFSGAPLLQNVINFDL